MRTSPLVHRVLRACPAKAGLLGIISLLAAAIASESRASETIASAGPQTTSDGTATETSCAACRMILLDAGEGEPTELDKKIAETQSRIRKTATAAPLVERLGWL